jgi:hypothetical protein
LIVGVRKPADGIWPEYMQIQHVQTSPFGTSCTRRRIMFEYSRGKPDGILFERFRLRKENQDEAVADFIVGTCGGTAGRGSGRRLFE